MRVVVPFNFVKLCVIDGRKLRSQRVANSANVLVLVNGGGSVFSGNRVGSVIAALSLLLHLHFKVTDSLILDYNCALLFANLLAQCAYVVLYVLGMVDGLLCLFQLSLQGRNPLLRLLPLFLQILELELQVPVVGERLIAVDEGRAVGEARLVEIGVEFFYAFLSVFGGGFFVINVLFELLDERMEAFGFVLFNVQRICTSLELVVCGAQRALCLCQLILEHSIMSLQSLLLSRQLYYTIII